MCNDFRLKAKIEYLIETFSEHRIPLRFEHGIPNLEPRDDIRITDRAPVVRMDAQGPRLDTMPWSWKGPHGGPVFNFRADGRRFAANRCLIPADGFYEFTGDKSPKTKWLFTLEGHDLFAIAGIVREGAFAMLTTPPGPDMAPFHDRQIAVLPPALWRGWLDGEPEATFLAPLPTGSLKSERVN
jgi:putative SOS response-associated peptidase YedK